MHEHLRGKIGIVSKMRIESQDDLSIAYTPGVAGPCLKIAENGALARELTIKRNTVAVVTDGSAVLGLGNIGPLAALPVMEGKALLFKEFANIDAWPICLDTQNADEIIETVLDYSDDPEEEARARGRERRAERDADREDRPRRGRRGQGG